MKLLLTTLSGVTLIGASTHIITTTNNTDSKTISFENVNVTSEVIKVDATDLIYETTYDGESITYNFTSNNTNYFHYNETSAIGSGADLSYKIFEIYTNIKVYDPVTGEQNYLSFLNARNSFEQNNQKNQNQISWGGDVFYPTSAFARNPHSIGGGPTYPVAEFPPAWVEERLKPLSYYQWESGLTVLEYWEFAAVKYVYDFSYETYKFEFIVGSLINPKWSLSDGKSWTNIGKSITFNYTFE